MELEAYLTVTARIESTVDQEKREERWKSSSFKTTHAAAANWKESDGDRHFAKNDTDVGHGVEQESDKDKPRVATIAAWQLTLGAEGGEKSGLQTVIGLLPDFPEAK